MIVTAKRIGNSKKESISVNNEIVLKSVEVGKWNYLLISKNEKYGCLVESKHKGEPAAADAFNQLSQKSSRELRVIEVSR